MFDNQKKNCLNKKDKSKKKTIDKDIKPLIDSINSHKDYYTTSSCSGRILLIEKKTDKKQDARFAFVEHKKADYSAIKKSLHESIGGRRGRGGGTRAYPKEVGGGGGVGRSTLKTKNDVWLKQESIIMHVCCRNLESAKKLLKIIRDLGIKRAGIIAIGKRIIIEIIGTEAMETIIARNGKMLTDDSYLKILVKEANKKLERNKKKIKRIISSLPL